MASFTTIDLNDFLPGQPATSAQGIALYENPLAIAEGASGAPKIAQKSAGGLSASGTLSFTGLGDFGGVLVHGSVHTDGSNRILEVSLSDDGTTYGAASALLDDSGIYRFTLFVDFATGAFKCTHDSIGPTMPLYAAGTLAGAGSNVSAIRFTIGGTSTIAAIVLPNGGESAS